MKQIDKEIFFICHLKSLGDELLMIQKYHEKHSAMLLMVIIDIAARIWDIYQEGDDLNGNQKARFINWCNKFMPTSSKEISSENIYKLRCSLLHFGGIPKPFMFEEHYNAVSKSQEFAIITKGMQVYVISRKFSTEFAQGFINMLRFFENEQNTSKYKEFIVRMVDKIEKEGSLLVKNNS